MTVALELVGVTIIHSRAPRDPVRVVDHLDLVLHDGRMHCVAGRTGAGKTSVLEVAGGLRRPSAGTVEWAGRELWEGTDDDVTLRRRNEVGYLDGAATLIDGLSILENVLIPAVPDRRSRELAPHATELLERLGVDVPLSTRASDLTVGERRLVALARALVRSPAILIADEPTAGLDRQSADDVIAFLRSVCDDGTAVLVSSHDVHVVDAADNRTQLA